MRKLEQTVLEEKLPDVETPEKLREFLNGGALYDLAYRLELVSREQDGIPFEIIEDDKSFTAYWLHKTRKRLLVVQNSLSRLPGLFLNLPVEQDEYKVAPGEISASFTPIDEVRRVPEPYSEGMVTVGNPQTVVKIMAVAGRELTVASGIVPREDI